MDEATRAQVAAADPRRSTWVSANAGSGKTRVLTNRVARLLLDGVKPDAILCLTYTKAAAAEMQTRLFDQLGAWAMHDNETLRAELQEMGAAAELSTERLAVARRLFAEALETPGGLKIQTIHAFCASLLRRFPVEAGLSPAFREIDDRSREMLRATVLDRVAQEQPELFEPLAFEMGGSDPAALIQEIMENRAAFDAPELDEQAVRRVLGLPMDESPEQVLSAFFDTDAMELMTTLATVLDPTAGASDKKLKDACASALTTTGLAQFEAIRAVLLTKDNAKRNKLVVAQTRKAHASLCARLEAWADHAEHIQDKLLAYDSLHKTRRLYRFARAIIDTYEQEKSARGYVDFDDLILRARHLLLQSDQAAWVLYKLDGGISHILVDEAQDTAPPQWDVISALMEEAFSGADAGRAPRTVFAVGDPKQSIYSFQGAAPVAFGQMREHFRARLAALPGTNLQEQPLAYSFRSAPEILRTVDAVMAVEGRAGLEESDLVQHQAFKTALPGMVELHPYVPAPPKPDPLPWYAPVDAPSATSPELVIAEQVAERIEALLATGQVPDKTGGWRKVTPADILVLVRRRKTFFHALLGHLKQRKVPVSGADRLTLTSSLAVRDVLALLRVVVLPTDDLSLAAVLRSPLADLSEERLFALAHGRRGYLIEAVRTAEDTATINAHIEALRVQADFARPYEMIDTILTTQGGRAKLTARLGAAAEDALDALLSEALVYEQTQAPTLPGFLYWLSGSDAPLKRDMAGVASEVRVMTVHGAKGLEAPIVILPETGPYQRDDRDERAVVVMHGIPLWKRGDKTRQPAGLRMEIEAQKDRVMQESERLLYVAMTRAENHLIVYGGGADGEEKRAHSWYGKIATALEGLSVPGRDSVMRLQSPLWDASAKISADTDMQGTVSEVVLPDWSHDPAAPTTRYQRPLSPSGLSEGLAHSLRGENVDGSEKALLRGSAVHLRLEHPDIDIAGHFPELSWAEKEAAISEADAVRGAHPGLFDGKALHEVPFAIDLAGSRMTGRIDLLRVSEARVWAIDFKSNRVVPETAEEIPEGVLIQLSAYHAALSQMFPQHDVEVAILWTASTVLMPIPHEMLRSADQLISAS